MKLVDFVLENQAAVAGAVVAVLDLLFALNKNMESNGILHSTYVLFKNITEKKIDKG